MSGFTALQMRFWVAVEVEAAVVDTRETTPTTIARRGMIEVVAEEEVDVVDTAAAAVVEEEEEDTKAIGLRIIRMTTARDDKKPVIWVWNGR
jgi:hypothetical protein